MLLIHGIVRVRVQVSRDAGEALVLAVVGLLGGAADDERGARLVDEDVIHLVDYGELALVLNAELHGIHHVVAQVVEAELVVRAVGDVGGVSLSALHAAQVVHAALGRLRFRVEEIGGLVLQDAHGRAEEVIELPHPLGVASREVVVDGNDMHAAGE